MLKRPAARGSPMSRRIRVILFADVKDSTGILASTENDGTGLLSATMKNIRSILERHGGQLFHSGGDGVAFFFGNVKAAVHAAFDMHAAASKPEHAIPI